MRSNDFRATRVGLNVNVNAKNVPVRIVTVPRGRHCSADALRHNVLEPGDRHQKQLADHQYEQRR
jgi:hypothetical protein